MKLKRRKPKTVAQTRGGLSAAKLAEMIEEATVDAYDECEQATGWCTSSATTSRRRSNGSPWRHRDGEAAQSATTIQSSRCAQGARRGWQSPSSTCRCLRRSLAALSGSRRIVTGAGADEDRTRILQWRPQRGSYTNPPRSRGSAACSAGPSFAPSEVRRASGFPFSPPARWVPWLRVIARADWRAVERRRRTHAEVQVDDPREHVQQAAVRIAELRTRSVQKKEMHEGPAPARRSNERLRGGRRSRDTTSPGPGRR